MSVKLHVNVDHVATLREARGTMYPDPVRAALLCEAAGADGITLHLREDRRHIQDSDVERMRASVRTVLNLEMAATAAMVDIALQVRPDLVTLVPEKREERTTEGGLDVAGQCSWMADVCRRLRAGGVRVHHFIDPDARQIDASLESAADGIEFHTGDYANAAQGAPRDRELVRLADGARHARRASVSLLIAAGHGLTVANTEPLVARVPEIVELNIGHAIVADAVFHGLAETVRRFREAILHGQAGR